VTKAKERHGAASRYGPFNLEPGGSAKRFFCAFLMGMDQTFSPADLVNLKNHSDNRAVCK